MYKKVTILRGYNIDLEERNLYFLCLIVSIVI
jgi:hypothetical protein